MLGNEDKFICILNIWPTIFDKISAKYQIAAKRLLFRWSMDTSGIVSYRSKVCGDGKPCIYVRVDSFLNWIESIMIQKIKKKNEGGHEGRQNKYMCTLYAMF